MTREEAIERLKHTDACDVDLCTALDMAIKALEQQKPCKDCVSRDAVLDLVADYDLSMGQVVKGIHALPSVTPQPCKTKSKKNNKNKDHNFQIDFNGRDPFCGEGW